MEITHFSPSHELLTELKPLIRALKDTSTEVQKLKILKEHSPLKTRCGSHLEICKAIEQLSISFQICLYSLFAIGQEQLFNQKVDHLQAALEALAEQLLPVEEFYREYGGIVGYHYLFLNLLHENKDFQHPHFREPPAIDLSQESAFVNQMIREGIESISSIAEIYPVAGSADRLDLRHELTHEPLPAAELKFFGHTLLEGLIRDLRAREYLAYKLTGKVSITPIVLMTSLEKNNHQHVCTILEKNHWFGRPQESFFIVVQPLAPMISTQGLWIMKGPFEVAMKPGGHGALWKLARDQGAFKWLAKKKRQKVLIRQINNPIGGLDYALLAFTGCGIQGDKAFGFLSCERSQHAAEGLNVLIEKRKKDKFSYAITNIEYTDFKKNGFDETHLKESKGYLANTNILFADLKVLKQALKKAPLPGLLINMKSVEKCPKTQSEVNAGRLESTMQNIADFISTPLTQPLQEGRELKTFLAYNTRQKTISVTKHSLKKGQSIQGTPEGAFYDYLKNSHELLISCNFHLPKFSTPEDYLNEGPSAIFTYHPGLGPLYAIIQKKIRGGTLHKHSQLSIELAEVDIENLTLDGSLFIQSKEPLGVCKKKILQEGRCTLRNVRVKNLGLTPENIESYWKFPLPQKETCMIYLEGSGEFVAENVTFQGPFKIEVPDRHRMTAYEKEGKIQFKIEPISNPSWEWKYTFSKDDQIELIKHFNV